MGDERKCVECGAHPTEGPTEGAFHEDGQTKYICGRCRLAHDLARRLSYLELRATPIGG